MTENIEFGNVTVETRDLVHKGKIIKSACLVAPVTMKDRYGLCGHTGELEINVGDLDIARRLQNVLQDRLKAALLLLLCLLFSPIPASAQVIAEWTWKLGAEIQEDGFEVERAPSGCTQWQLAAINPPNVMSMEVPDVPGDCWRARGFIGAEYFPYSNIGIVPEAPLPPPPPPPCRPRGKSGKCK